MKQSIQCFTRIFLTSLLGLSWQGSATAQPAAMPEMSEILQLARFTINEFVVEGNSLMPNSALQSVLAPYTGPDKGFDDLDAARSALLDAYARAGYELVSVEYDGTASQGGVHHLRVWEVQLAAVKVSGAQVLKETSVRGQLPSLRENTTPDLDRLARELFLFNDNPGRQAGIAYSVAEQGRIDAEVQITERQQSRFNFTLNNTGTPETGRTRGALTWNHYDAFGAGHQAMVNVSASLEDIEKMRGVNIGYRIPLPALGDAVTFGAGASRVKVGLVADVFNIAGESETWSFRYIRNLHWTTNSRHVLEFGYDERHYRDLIDFMGTNLGTAVSAKPISLTYRQQYTWSGRNLGLGLTWQRNMAGGGRNGDAAYAANRSGADADWSSLQLNALWQQSLPKGWSWSAQLAGQYANEPLISAEQYGLGGERAVRGFGERVGAGDRVLLLRSELYTPPIGGTNQLVIFVDGGRSSRLNVLPGESASERLLGYGLGWRAALGNSLQIVVDAARVAEGTALFPGGSTRIHATAMLMF